MRAVKARLAGLAGLAGLVGLALLVTACSDPLAPEAIAGRYEARGLPKSSMQVEGHLLELLSASLELGADGQGTRRFVVRRTVVGTGEVVILDHQEPLRYTIDGMRVRTTVAHVCPGQCSSVVDPPDYRILPGGGSLVEMGMHEPMRYDRLPHPDLR